MFNLTDYEKEIREGATKADVAPVEAAKQFVYNLVVLRPRFDYFPASVDFRALGQKWNALSSDVRNSQKDLLMSRLNRTRNVRE